MIKVVKNTLLAMVWISLFLLAFNAPDLPLNVHICALVGYLAAFGFLCFAGVHIILIFGRK